MPRRKRWKARKSSVLEDNFSQREIPAVRDGKRNVFHTQPLGEFTGHSVEPQRWFAGRLAHHFDIPTAHAEAPARSQRFHRRFFGRETPRIVLEFAAKAFAVGNFSRRV